MSEMIEKVARALCVEDGYNPDHESDDPCDEGVKLWTLYRTDARAAVEAMRVPTKDMMGPCEESCSCLDWHWHDMIARALGEPTENDTKC